MTDHPAIVWFRRDLRLADNPALFDAIDTGAPLILLYILEGGVAEQRGLGGAAKWWLDKSLRALQADIQSRGGKLIMRRGDPQQVLKGLMEDTGADTVFWTRRYEQAARDIDSHLKKQLKDQGHRVESRNGSLLTEPWTITTGSGGHYRVFTPYWKAMRAQYAPPPPLEAPASLNTLDLESDALEDWDLHPSTPDWSTGFDGPWTPGEAGARERLDTFLKTGLDRLKA